MTGNEIRKNIVAILNGWVGAKAGSATHKEILKIYNEWAKAHNLPLAYESYPWCAITACAAVIKAGIAEYMPISMSCGQIIEQAKKLGYWTGNDAHKPKLAEWAIFDWSDNGKGDADGHDHIGTVSSVGPKTFTTIEGNSGTPGEVKKRNYEIDGRYVAHFICPDYDAIAKKLTPAAPAKKPTLNELAKAVINGDYGSGAVRKSKLNSLYKKGEIDYTYDQIQARVNELLKPKEVKPKEEKKKEVKASQAAKSFDSSYNRNYVTLAKLNLRDGAGTGYKVLTLMPKSRGVRCYGYYTKVNNVTWLYVQYKDGDTTYTGFCSKEWLA